MFFILLMGLKPTTLAFLELHSTVPVDSQENEIFLVQIMNTKNNQQRNRVKKDVFVLCV